MLLIVFSVTTLYFLWKYFKSNNRSVELELAPLDPRDIDYIDYDFFLRENTHSRSDKSSGCPQSDCEPTSAFSKRCDQLPTLPNSKPDVIRKELDQISFSPASWEENDM